MKKKLIATPSRTNEILKRYQLEAKKSLGQNFLMEPQVLADMVATGEIDQETNVIEIGPGIGALTEVLAQEAKEVLAFELDQRLLPVLANELADYDNIHIRHADILEVDIKATVSQYFSADERLLVVANLPYYITTPIIFKLLESGLRFDGFVLMMQKEVAERLTASPNSKAYGSLTIAIDYYCEAEIAFTVPRTVFKPRPNVDSAILYLKRRPEAKLSVQDEDFFFRLVRASFKQRRKTLWNNLRQFFGKDPQVLSRVEEALDQAGIDPKRRAETLTIEEFARLSDALVQVGCS
ncbi:MULTISPECIES: 16S rRNA (adenine(1518)-N(6)/adenine(1519)-N(6))-dimethyltransferase RsmA [Aerococcus]|uniref:Ribosomal RNA small subunit methyltransferase A n=1 Tax=Aerococcus sanguinicola TaxID=119206 RepID=A0A5N1GQ22_9LACT|nr:MULTISPECIES: 16S rRNA (adenine(1518)-N(6)/adenine(1519)-N(6))-dimethyltransferase RsmA [Aerococcus]KAA9302318.1 16S rRNA (adenine(1518)-N(6)/adenine(1519)-N(6))-dimethyltransferase RsmA [Aerococcus sanguinicola]MDK6678974.1 16S rRNA (adenine(1518)-N(6)/adenine(1519)-N(6))-dimethyltransferase RsmA [Aerococcus sp. UMB8608]MDK6686565.1 16S rRNA (adenine(1518)-N(6)/adenine(1519)-N(6))-dimethyltransferase RsmA [Aerococcus sp. UMB8623]MDK6939633.1 16S rRNA (adenine(1518)-N(6)/adenine(1519)-N(6))-